MRRSPTRIIVAAAALAVGSACGNDSKTGSTTGPASARSPSSYQVRLLASAETKEIEIGLLRILDAHRQITLSDAIRLVRGTPVTIDWALSKAEADGLAAEITAIGAKAEASEFTGSDAGPSRPPQRKTSVVVLEIPKGSIVYAVKTIREHTALGINEAAEATKDLPRRVPKDFSKDEADALVKALAAVGVKAEAR